MMYSPEFAQRKWGVLPGRIITPGLRRVVPAESQLKPEFVRRFVPVL
jgi:hypothetical protein